MVYDDLLPEKNNNKKHQFGKKNGATSIGLTTFFPTVLELLRGTLPLMLCFRGILFQTSLKVLEEAAFYSLKRQNFIPAFYSLEEASLEVYQLLLLMALC